MRDVLLGAVEISKGYIGNIGIAADALFNGLEARLHNPSLERREFVEAKPYIEFNEIDTMHGPPRYILVEYTENPYQCFNLHFELGVLIGNVRQHLNIFRSYKTILKRDSQSCLTIRELDELEKMLKQNPDYEMNINVRVPLTKLIGGSDFRPEHIKLPRNLPYQLYENLGTQ